MKNELLKKFYFKKSKRAADHAGAGLGSIGNAYGRYSDEKAKAWDQCAAICDDLGGYGLTVCGKNTFSFSAGFYFENDDGARCFAYITPKTRVFSLV